MSRFDRNSEGLPICHCSPYRIGGAAMTEAICVGCLKTEIYGSTATPTICDKCKRKSKYRGRCDYCLGMMKE